MEYQHSKIMPFIIIKHIENYPERAREEKREGEREKENVRNKWKQMHSTTSSVKKKENFFRFSQEKLHFDKLSKPNGKCQQHQKKSNCNKHAKEKRN